MTASRKQGNFRSPRLEAELVSSVLYAGEIPVVRLRITAPPGRSLKMIRPEAAWETGALDFYLHRPGKDRGHTGRGEDMKPSLPITLSLPRENPMRSSSRCWQALRSAGGITSMWSSHQTQSGRSN